MSTQVSAFTDDVLGACDAVAIADLVRRGEVSAAEVADATLARIAAVDPELHAVAGDLLPDACLGDPAAPLYGVPTLVKDNSDLAGLPTTHGSVAFDARPAQRDGAFVRQLLGTGLTALGKSRMPEFGFNASTEFMDAEPARNAWHTDYSTGASSGGAAALVASGALAIAHANDGGGSIRIPAATAGLVGLKPSRGRHIDGDLGKQLPINIISEGVLTRSVRDTAAYLAAAEDVWRNPALPPIGLVTGPARRRLRVGLLLETADGFSAIDAETRTAVERAATLLEGMGHLVEPIPAPVTPQFSEDFLQYWKLLAELVTVAGKVTFDRSFDTAKTDNLTLGLRRMHRESLLKTPGAVLRLRRHTQRDVARMFTRHEVVLSPVLAHVTPKLGYLAATLDADLLLERLRAYVAYTPLQNIAGTPAISVPLGSSTEGLPIGVQLSTAYADERTLLELAFALEEARPFPTLAR